ncbi:MAG: GNAT family N-acetyltransferase [Anaerorhabdus sp.]
MKIKTMKYPNNLDDCYKIRKEVFVDEQGFKDEFDEIDKSCLHLCVYEEGNAVATGRMFLNDQREMTIGRVCVIAKYRGLGYGNAVILELEKIAKSEGFSEVHLSSQVKAKKFYEKLGYTSSGEEYLDQHEPHIHMKKELK